MEALASAPRALFPRASPAALLVATAAAAAARHRCAAPVCRASASAGEETPPAAPKAADAAAAPKKILKKKPVYSSKTTDTTATSSKLNWSQLWMLASVSCMHAVKKGQIVRVDKEKYLNSINVSSSTKNFTKSLVLALQALLQRIYLS